MSNVVLPKFSDFFDKEEWAELRSKGGTFEYGGFTFQAKPIENRIKVTGIYKHNEPHLGTCFNFTVNKDIQLIVEENYSAICKAIEFVINGGTIKYVDGIIENAIAPLHGTFTIKTGNGEYTEEDMRKCFQMAREVGKANMSSTYTYTFFEDYFKTISND